MHEIRCYILTSLLLILFVGENQTIPPMPVLYLLSHDGVLCLFYVINLSQPLICSPPEPLPEEVGFVMQSLSPIRNEVSRATFPSAISQNESVKSQELRSIPEEK